MLLALLPYIASAQSAEASWSNLGRLRTGQKIEVVDMKLKAVAGNFSAFTDDAISLLAGKDQVSIPRADVLSVKNREASHRKRNTLLGLAIGAAGGLAAGAIAGATSSEEGEIPVFLLVTTPIGAGLGGAVGAVLPAGQVTVYRAKARSRP
jgi:hypothetical protein